MIKIVFLVLGSTLITGIFWYVFFYHKEKKLIKRMQNMVDRAADGSLKYQEISEESLSALENSLKRYLDDSMLSSQNQKKQKEMVQSLISDIAHQTLTPISNLKIYGELLNEEVDEKSEVVSTILEQTGKLDFLIQSLVKLSRMENGIISVHPVPTKITELLDTLKQEYTAKALEKNISLTTVCPTELEAVFDKKWMLEAVGNIVDNAVKYTEQGGKIELHVESYSFFSRIDVKDTGIGMKEEEIPKIFTRFYRSFSVADEPGVGIGLYLAREIIQAQKGYIKVSSKEGEGSVFSVFLPTVEMKLFQK